VVRDRTYRRFRGAVLAGAGARRAAHDDVSGMSEYAPILVPVSKAVVVVTLNRPSRLNDRLAISLLPS